MRALAIIILSSMAIAACAGGVETGDVGSGGGGAGGGGAGGGARDGAGSDAGSDGAVVNGQMCSPIGTTTAMLTCLSDCECVPGLVCRPCVATADHACTDYCHPGDPRCNWGVVTCPVGPGKLCDAVKLCQAPLHE